MNDPFGGNNFLQSIWGLGDMPDPELGPAGLPALVSTSPLEEFQVAMTGGWYSNPLSQDYDPYNMADKILPGYSTTQTDYTPDPIMAAAEKVGNFFSSPFSPKSQSEPVSTSRQAVTQNTGGGARGSSGQQGQGAGLFTAITGAVTGILSPILQASTARSAAKVKANRGKVVRPVPQPRGKKPDNTMYWVLGIGAVVAIGGIALVSRASRD